MDITAILQSLEAMTVASWVRESDWAFPMIESVHVIALVLVFGTIAIVDLRLLGMPTTSVAFTAIARDCLLWTWAAFGLAVITGALMFVANATSYYDNFPFRMKMLCLVLAGINMAVFELVTFRGVSRWDKDHPVPIAGKIAGTLSLTFWIATITFGRWIGFTKVPF
ncbi:DUF6644 family protein [Arenibaculum pallidiluteum]|uniref:DUF6644 family protein n=1 Tax=Arenibaculum pallidiluteum TaxID=2812559 RepID=UPI001A95C292|nr:DUF6644 family protein [Arenibaculum pallidiluteum]